MPRVLVVKGPGLDGRCTSWGAEAGVEVSLECGPLPAALAAAGPVDAAVLAPGPAAFDSEALAAAVAEAGVPVVAVEPGNLRKQGVDPDASPLGRACTRVLYGRGPDTGRFALQHLAWRAARPLDTLAYGRQPDRVGDLWVPDGPGRHPVAVLLHGGFWYHAWERDLMDGLAVDLARRGWAAWNLEYRRLGAGGGWPTTGDDVALGIDHLVPLARVYDLDLGRVALVGHSAGGQLALWAAARGRRGAVHPRVVVGLAPITDLRAARDERIGGRSVEHFLATAPDAELALHQASPLAHVPIGVRQVLAHAVDDEQVPMAHTLSYARAARVDGDHVTVIEAPAGAGGHFGLIDPRSPIWAEVATVLEREGRSARP
jgi:acetyl esterase/lipase